MSDATLLWLRQDLRLTDNPALREAVSRNLPVVPVFIWSPHEERPWSPGAASRWWLHQSLLSLDADLRKRGSRLVIREGPSLEALSNLAEKTGARSVVWSRRYEPVLRRRDAALRRQLATRKLAVHESTGSLLFEPESILSSQGRPYQVFSAFWRACQGGDAPPAPAGTPRRIPGPRRWPASLKVAHLGLEPTRDWAGGLEEAWNPGEAGARKALRRFVREVVGDYDLTRDLPGQRGTSRLSPYLHFGEISPRQIWHEITKGAKRRTRIGADTYLKEIGWREFAYHLLYHFPETPARPLREQFSRFPWRRDRKRLRAWQQGRTGYPIVDAGMRELWHTGWMHNRVRMIVASFLVKHLLIRWQDGAAWFWDTLVDADLASNTLGWQWTAGCGADAAPYFRIFNPFLQGEKFDSEGTYVRRWVPELARVPSRWIHRPWMAPARVLEAAGVQLGGSYPEPIVDHTRARYLALEAFASLKEGGS